MKIRDRYRQEFLRCDFWLATAAYCMAIAVVIAIGSGVALSARLASVKAALYASMFSLAGGMLGFLISAIAIIIAFGELPRFQLFRDSGQYKNASIVFFSAMRWFAVLTVAAFVVLLVDTSASQWTPAIYAIGWLALISSARLCRCMWILVKLTKIAVSPNRLNNDRHAA